MVDYAIDTLRAVIRSRRLVPGQRLVVADIPAMLSVSAGPVREAIRRLTGERLIEIVPHRGASTRRITHIACPAMSEWEAWLRKPKGRRTLN